VETAEILCSRLSLTPRLLDGLHEHDRREAGFLDREAFDGAVRNFFAHAEDLVFGSETAAQARIRFTGAIHALIEEYPRETLAVVSHGTVISLFAAELLSAPPFELWKSLALPSFLVLDVPAGKLLAYRDCDERDNYGNG
jgi:broad specificity phosphatase PhoE